MNSIFDDYRIVETLSHTDSKIVYRGIHKLDSHSVIIKTLRSAYPQAEEIYSLQNEYDILKNININNISRVRELRLYENNLALILEDSKGLSLDAFLQQSPLSIIDSLKIGIQLARILRDVHGNKIIHQDIKPSNIIICSQDLQVKIIDFSLAKYCKTSLREKSDNTDTLSFAGTLAYISPEQTGRIEKAIDYRTDLYSLGVTFYEMLAGKRLFDSEDPLKLIHYHLACNPTPLHQIKTSIPQAISNIVSKLLSKNTEDRYQSAYGLQVDLEACLLQLQNKGEIKKFALGKLDNCGKFRLPNRLYGRSPAMTELIDSYDRIVAGNKEIIFLEGDTGVGKTALINEFETWFAGNSNYLVKGKFERFKSDVPYSAFIEGFSSLIQQLLQKSLETRQYWQEKIVSYLGSNVKLICDLIPDLESIVGSQSDVPELAYKEAKNRFNRILIEFISLFTEYNLFIFLDNLQWADSASIELIDLLINNSDCQHLEIICAYRPHEIDLKHPFREIINNFNRDRNINSRFIILDSLDLCDLRQLVVDTFDCKLERGVLLAELIFNRTRGNPFFIRHLLQTLYKEKLITFDFYNSTWNWDLNKIKATNITNLNLVELTISNLQKLNPESQRILELAACIGNTFELSILAKLNQKSLSETIVDLRESLANNIIATTQANFEIAIIGDRSSLELAKQNASDVSYKFLHDRLQQTAYALIPPAKKEQIHLKIGQLLLQSVSKTQARENIFEIVKHLNLAHELLKNRPEKEYLARLNLIAAQKAKKEIAYGIAGKYLEVGKKLLDCHSWQKNYQLTFDLYLSSLENEYLLGNLSTIESTSNLILDRCNNVLDRAKVYKIVIHVFIARNQMQNAIDAGVEILNLMNVNLPATEVTIADITNKLNLTEGRIKPLQEIPLIKDPLAIAALQILEIIIPPIYIVKPQFFPTIVFKLIDLCLEYGNSPKSAFAYALYGLLLCTVGNVTAGYKFGNLALILLDKFNARAIEPKVNFVFNNTIQHWQEPGRSVLANFAKDIDKSIEVGDIEYAGFHAKYYCAYLFFLGEPLRSASKKSATQLEMMAKSQQDFQLNYARIWQQVNLNLQGKSQHELLLVGESFNELEILPNWLESNNATALFAIYLAKLILCYLFKEYEQALNYGKLAEQYQQAAIGTMCFVVYYFYYALTILATIDSQEIDNRKQNLEKVTAFQQQMQQWSIHAPDNYLHKYQLITAELARVTEQYETAAEFYDRAIESALTSQYIQESALAAELAAEFYKVKGRKKIAKLYFSDAYYNYKSWQALAKTRDLKSRYPEFLSDRVTNVNSINKYQKHTQTKEQYLAVLDLLSLIKASQTISEEIILDNLLPKFMEIVMESAGAHKGVLFLQEGNALTVVAEGTIDSQKNISLTNLTIREYNDCPLTVINYTQNTKKPVVLANAVNEGMFVKDPYIIKNKSQSIISFPIFNREQLQGIIYLENHLVRDAFTKQRIEILKILLSQVSISIENARLYNNLENHASVKKSLHEKEILLKEIHHRVKNNLFVVANLLEMQTSYIDDPEILKMFEDSQNRIESMALIHQHLYGNSQLDRIDFNKYTTALIENLSYSHSINELGIEIITDITPVELNVETANPCGLIINELVANCIEHGFPHQQENKKIWLTLTQDTEQQLTLSIKDNGVGFPEDKDLENNDSLGLELVCTLVEQLDGSIELIREGGTAIAITFAELNYHARI